MIYDHLNDITTYKKLDKDIDKDTLKLLAWHMNKHINSLAEDERKYFKNISSSTGNLFSFPKQGVSQRILGGIFPIESTKGFSQLTWTKIIFISCEYNST